MSLNLKIPGSPTEIRSAAQWLDPTLHSALVDMDLEASYMVSDATTYWTGESGYAFNSTAQAIRRSNFAVPEYVSDTAETMRAYAGRLERGADDFAGFADYARSKGLATIGTTISYPTTTLRVCPDPNGPDSPELREWNAYMSRVSVYQDLSARVGTWWGELDVWIAEEFGKLVASVENLQEASTVRDGLIAGNEEVVGLAFEYADARAKRNIEDFRAHVSQLTEDAKTFQAQLRSGNPALKAAAEAADPRAMRQAASALSDMIQGVGKSARIIPIVGGVIDVVATGAEIASGGSESSALVGLTAGLGGGIAAAGIIAAVGVTVPPVGVAIVVAGAAWGAGELATMAWEAWVPLDTREAIDAGIEDFLDVINPVSWFTDGP